jgi:hypothetical protein
MVSRNQRIIMEEYAKIYKKFTEQAPECLRFLLEIAAYAEDKIPPPQ